jgi:hypothetical protein
MRKIIAIFFLIGWMSSCKSKNSTSSILPLDTMRVVIFDFLIADEWHNARVVKDTTEKKFKNSFKMYQEVLDIHKITKGKFDSSFTYYTEHPDKMKILIDTVNSYITKMKDKAAPKVK